MDYSDLDLREPSEPPTRPPAERDRAVWLGILGVLVALAAGGAWWWFARGNGGSEPAPVIATESPGTPAEPAALGGAPAEVEVPPLDESDAFVRQLVSTLSSDPRLLAWLATDGLVRTFAVVVTNVAEGESPATHLRLMRPLTEFRVTEQDGRFYVDPRGYDRYNSLAAAAASVDPAGSARAYATLKPRIEEAYQALGYPDVPFDQMLERAIVTLLETPIVDTAPRIVPSGGTGYGYADPRLENLKPAQKQLLRVGPRNARAIQEALRNIALALGIPPDRLPAASA